MKHTKRYLLAALLCVSYMALEAQVTVTIPVNNDNDDWQNNPYGCADAYQRMQSLYTANEIGLAGNITSIGFYVNALNNPNSSTPVVIKLKNTKSNTLIKSSYDDASLNATTVYSGNILSSQLSPNGWVMVTLTTPFTYAGYNLEVFVETNNGFSGEDWDAKQFRWSEVAATVSQMWSGWMSPPGPTDYGWFSTLHPNVRFTIATAPAMTYASSTAEQVIGATHAGANKQKVLSIKVNTNGLSNAIAATAFNLNSNGSASTPGLITNARLYFTGINSSFDTTQQFGSTVANPAGVFSFSGNRTLEAGVNHFWLTYDLSSSALPGDSVDAECTQVTIGSNNYTPSVTAPAGKMPVGRLFDFEAAGNQGFDAQSYTLSPGKWQRGTPLDGPGAAFSGNNCWGTDLNGDYEKNEDYALVSPPMIVENNEASLSYKQWFDFAREYNDIDLFIEYQVNNGGWQTLSEINTELKHTTSGAWEDAFFPVPAGTGDTIQFRWHMITYQYTDLATGWYIDNMVFSGCHPFAQSYVISYTGQAQGLVIAGSRNKGIVHVNIETMGSDNPLSVTTLHFTTNGTGTVSNIETAKVYYTGSSRNFDTSVAYGSPVVSPFGAFAVNGSQTLVPGINHFWLAYDVSANGLPGDSLDATCPQITLSSGTQTPAETDPAGNIAIGYLYDFDTVSMEAFDTYALNGNPNQWEKGTPGFGPASAFSGTDCWGTNLNGDYAQNSDYALVSPPYIATGSLVSIAYKQWFNFRWTYAGINAEFQYQVNNNGFWNTLAFVDNSTFASSNNKWEDVFGDLSTNAGDTIQFRWHFHSNMWSSTAPGWYIDNFAVAGLNLYNQTYQSCDPQSIIAATYGGALNQPVLCIPVQVSGSINPLTLSTLHFSTNGTGNVAAIDSARVLYSGNNKRFDAAKPFGTAVVSPSGTFSITGSQELASGTNYFWLAYDVDSNATINDSLDAEISQIVLSTGNQAPLTTAPQGYVTIGNLYTFDTTSYEDFVALSLNGNPNQWEKGMPNSGPYAAYSGTDCWATNLNGDIKTNSDYFVQTPPYVAVLNEVNVNFKQWFDFVYTGSNIDGMFEYQVNNSGWNPIYTIDNGNFANSGYTWETVESNVPVIAGDTIQFRWRLSSATWSPEAPGWYFDNFVIAGAKGFDQVFQSATVSQVNEGTVPGTRQQAIINILINTNGSDNPLTATSFNLSTNGSVNTAIESAQLFYTGARPTFDTLTPFGVASVSPSGIFTINGTQALGSGMNNFWLAYNIAPGALDGDSVDAECTQVTISSSPYSITGSAPSGAIPVGRLYTFDTASLENFSAVSLNTNINQWEKGAPTSGPGAAFSGSDCWATSLNGDFNSSSDYVLTSPPYVAKGDIVHASYKQWFDFLYRYNDVNALFEYNINNSGWSVAADIDNQVRDNSAFNWEQVNTQIYMTIGDTIQFRWRFMTTRWSEPGPGWYIDNFAVAGASPFTQSYLSSYAEQLSGGTYGGAKHSPVIRVAVETSGSNNPLVVNDLSFNATASTALIQSARVYYTGNANVFDTTVQFGSPVSSPSSTFNFTGSTALNPGTNYFWLAYDVIPGALPGDSLDAIFTQITVASVPYTPSVSDPAGSLPVGHMYNFEAANNEDFTTISLNNTVVEWERGTPAFIDGPSASYSGANCWGTNLTGDFTLNSDYALLTPPYIATKPELFVNYKQWYEFIYTSWNKRAEFQFQVNNSGTWNTMMDIDLTNTSSSGGNWLDENGSLSVNTGDTVQFRWRLYTGTYDEAPGWYIDNFLITGGTPIDVFAPTISYTKLSHINSLLNRTVTNFASITDLKGVDVTPGTMPRLYFKKSSEANAFAGNSSTNNGWKYVEATNTASPFSFVIDYSLLTAPAAQNDTIVYFVTAQDLNIPANTGANPSQGFEASSVGNITSAPMQPDFYVLTAPPMSGNYNVGAGQVYTTISAAVTDLNLRGVSGPVTLTLTNSTYTFALGETFPITFYPVAGASATNTITVKPAASNNVSISANNASFKIQGADHIIIDGSNAGTSSRNMTLIGTGTTAVIWLCANSSSDGAQNNVIKNCVIRGDVNTKFGIYSGNASYTSVNSAVAAPSSFNRFENNLVSKVLYGMYMTGAAKTRPDENNSFIRNQFGDATTAISMIGIYNKYHVRDSIASNNVENINFAFTNTYQPASGIYLEFCKESFISANKITNWRSTLGDTRLSGIFVDGGEDGYNGPVLPTNNIIVNNFIGNGYSSSPNTWNIDGLMVFNGSGDKVYYNTVSLTGALLKTDGSVTAFRSGDYNLQNADIRNNIFYINGSSTGFATFISHVSYADYSFNGCTSDYNLLSCTATGNATAFIGEYYYNAISTLSDWQTITGQDANSKSADVTFVSASDLHLAGSSIGDSTNLSGTALAGFTTDIDGQPRHSVPYMGADENTSTPLPVKLLEFNGTAVGEDVVLSWITVLEKNNKGFTLERSTDNKTFSAVTFVKGKNTTTRTQYEFTDRNAFAVAPVLYYRLKQTDNNGAYEYSESISVSQALKAGSGIVIYPNPFVKDVYVQLESAEASSMTATISDITGRVIATSTHEMLKGKNTIQVISNDALQAGIYFLTIETSSGRQVIKLIRQ